ncbi:reverse transcriptase domain-containing protein [Tanacetum coccineum]
MPPMRNRYINDIYEQELEQRIMARIDERFNQIIDQLANRMNDMMNPRRRRDHNSRGSEDEEPENLVNILEFDGNTLNPEGFIDWLVVVEEMFEFKEVPENKRVSLIATKLRGRASTWWKQLKLTRERVGQPRVTSWRKMKKLLRENFIPHNYQRLMYQRLQNLKQGTKSVEDYTIEFYQLIARNDIQETDDQLVFGYISGLRDQIIDYVNMFDPVTLSDAYQCALAFEKQNRRVESSSSPAITGGGSGSSNVASHFSVRRLGKELCLLSLRNGKMMAWLMTIMKSPGKTRSQSSSPVAKEKLSKYSHRWTSSYTYEKLADTKNMLSKSQRTLAAICSKLLWKT